MNRIANPKLFAELPHPFAIQLTGGDAAKVINNLSTNDIGKLTVGQAGETFVTDARGWVVAHAGVVKGADQAWLVGCHPTPGQIADHVDRYIIREAAVVNDRSAEMMLLTIHDHASSQAEPPAAGSASADSPPADGPSLVDALDLESVSSQAFICSLPIWGPGTQVLCCPREHAGELREKLNALGYAECADEHFEWLRISGFWPLQSVDIGDKTIPQELDRDQLAISFTKGCYLGQETIARLDARGQLQKKLCLVELDAGGECAVGDAFQNGEKEVGRITSLAGHPESGQVRGLAYLRRGNFAVGTRLTCNGLAARVLR